MNKVTIIYHKEDNDGVFSGALFLNYFNDKYLVDLCPEDYLSINKLDIDKICIESYKVIITDISFKKEIMKYLFDNYSDKVIWIDHHKPIIDTSDDDNFSGLDGIRDISNSAVYNGYKYLYNNRGIPKLVELISCWDTFSFTDENINYIRSINLGLTQISLLDIFKASDMLDDVLMDNIIDEAYYYGSIINKWQKEEWKKLMVTSTDLGWTLSGHPSVCLFYNGASSSLMFDYYKNTRFRHGIVIKIKNCDDEFIPVSVYNINKNDLFDIGQYCKEKWNGGGHVGAGGFLIKREELFENIINKERKI